MRLRACTAAYDYVLLECCRSVRRAVPATATPLTRDQRFTAETALLEAGFSWWSTVATVQRGVRRSLLPSAAVLRGSAVLQGSAVLRVGRVTPPGPPRGIGL